MDTSSKSLDEKTIIITQETSTAEALLQKAKESNLYLIRRAHEQGGSLALLARGTNEQIKTILAMLDLSMDAKQVKEITNYERIYTIHTAKKRLFYALYDDFEYTGIDQSRNGREKLHLFIENEEQYITMRKLLKKRKVPISAVQEV